jgi:hypothetical protein
LASPFISRLREKLRFDAEGLGASRNEKPRAQDAVLSASSACTSRNNSLAQSRQRPQPEPTPSSKESCSTEHAPLRAHSRTAFSVTALQMQMYKLFSLLIEKHYH